MDILPEVPSPFSRAGDFIGLPDEVLAGLDENRAALFLDLADKVALEQIAADNLKVAQPPTWPPSTRKYSILMATSPKLGRAVPTATNR